MKSSSLDCGLLKSSSESIEGEAVVRGVAGRACLVKRVETVSGRLLGRVDTASDSEAFRFLTAEGVVGGGQGAESAVMTESAARWDEGRVGVGERERERERRSAVTRGLLEGGFGVGEGRVAERCRRRRAGEVGVSWSG